VFFGARPSCAWVPGAKVQPFGELAGSRGDTQRLALSRKCKTAAFRCALKQADAETAAQQAQPVAATSSAAVLKPDAKKGSARAEKAPGMH
jgi:hypothetical protein